MTADVRVDAGSIALIPHSIQNAVMRGSRDDRTPASFGELYSQVLEVAFHVDTADMPIWLSLLVGPLIALIIVLPLWLYLRLVGR